MLENMTTGEKALIGATAIGIAALVFHKPTRNAVGLSDGRKKNMFSQKKRKALRRWNGKQYTLYKSGSKDVVEAYYEKYGKPKWATDMKIIKVGNEYRLYYH